MKTPYYLENIEEVTINNADYRRVLFTSHYSQLVVMNLEPGVEIGEEVHGLDQFIRIESGAGTLVLNGDERHAIEAESAMVIPAGLRHNLINTGDEALKLYSVYSPPEHKDGIIQPTKADEAKEHFDGGTSVE